MRNSAGPAELSAQTARRSAASAAGSETRTTATRRPVAMLKRMTEFGWLTGMRSGAALETHTESPAIATSVGIPPTSEMYVDLILGPRRRRSEPARLLGRGLPISQASSLYAAIAVGSMRRPTEAMEGSSCSHRAFAAPPDPSNSSAATPKAATPRYPTAYGAPYTRERSRTCGLGVSATKGKPWAVHCQLARCQVICSAPLPRRRK